MIINVHRYYNRYREFKSFIGCQKKIVHLVDRTYLFKIGNLVYDGREIVRSLFHTSEVTSCVRDTKASNEYIFKGASVHPTLL